MRPARIFELKVMLAMISTIYPFWLLIVYWLEPSAYDPAWQRLSIGACALVFLALSHFTDIGRRCIEALYALSGSMLMVHIIFLAGENNLSTLYAFGSFLAFFAVSAGFYLNGYFLIYSACSLAGAFFLTPDENTIVPKLLFMAIIGTAALVSLISNHAKFSLLESIRLSHLRLRNIIIHSPIACLYAEDGVVSANCALRDTVGEGHSLAGTSVLHIMLELFPANQGMVESVYREARRSGNAKSQIMSLIRSDGSLRQVEVAGYCDDKVEVWTFVDETAKLSAQAAMLHSAKMASLGEMAGGIAHELNNPLAIIRGYGDLLNNQLSSDNVSAVACRRMIERINLTIDRIAAIVHGLRKFSRNEENDEVEKSVVSVEAMIEDSLALCRESLKARFIDLRVDISPEVSGLKCYPVEVSQIVLNLVNNARDAVTDLPEKWIHLEVKARDDFLVIAVTDSGSGIEDSLADKIMQPFFTTKEVGQGTGLGLSIASTLARHHHGRLEYDRKSENTRFALSLPGLTNFEVGVEARS